MGVKIARDHILESVKESRDWVTDSLQWLNDLEARVKKEVKPEKIKVNSKHVYCDPVRNKIDV